MRLRQRRVGDDHVALVSPQALQIVVSTLVVSVIWVDSSV